VIRRGDVVLVVASGDFGKPRPAVVVQADIAVALGSVVVCLITSDLTNAAGGLRIAVDPSPSNGLHRPSQVMVDKVVALARSRIRGPVGSLEANTMDEISRSLALLLDLV
jgi:mRNA interferase MazF